MILKRSFLTFAICCSLLVGAMPCSVSADEPDLTIGSKAPPLDIEHWLQDGNGAYKPVKNFKKGKVYVVEFWATWCSPCIMSMPHLAELQKQYRDQVQIISVTKESLETVEELMGKVHPKAGVTFDELTSSYCLTADPDESSYRDYMVASKSDGIPNSFLVGKTGLIEWIGHPMSMDDVLAEVIEGTWDREAFMEQAKQDRELQKNMAEISELAGSGKLDESLEMVEQLIKDAPTKVIKDHWTNIQHNLKLMAKKIDPETTAYFNDQLADMEQDGNLQAMLSFGNMLFGIDQEGGEIGTLGKSTIKTLQAYDISKIPAGYPVLYYNTIALLNEIDNNFLKAAEAQSKAVEEADERQKRRMMPYLKELRLKAGLDKPEKSDKQEKSDKPEKKEAAAGK